MAYLTAQGGQPVLILKEGTQRTRGRDARSNNIMAARILVCTSIGRRDWTYPQRTSRFLDPPSNPKKWIQRFGRILRQPGGKRLARTYALISLRTHEKKKLFSVKRKAEKIYGFTQRLVVKPRARALPKEQRILTQVSLKEALRIVLLGKRSK